jgi:aldehyde dehydrogenase (NAD+)
VTQPHDEATSFGPLISAGQRDKVLGYIETGKKEGARVVTGGQKWPKSGGGFWIEPTILADTTLDMKVVQEEVSRGFRFATPVHSIARQVFMAQYSMRLAS